jgi:EmrB/QacA subfamily drug resistance transporter
MSSDVESSAAGTSATQGRPARNPWVIFSVIALIEFLTVMDASVVNIALPAIRDGLSFSPTTIAWVVDAYLIGFAGFLLLAGRATDFIGRRRLFLIGVVTFTIFSLLCAAAVEPWHLVVARVLQGFGAALVFPAALALITDIFPEGPSRGKAIGLFSGMAGLAAPVGLVLGGLLTTVSWELIFLINIPIGVAVLVASFILLPSPRPSTAQGRLDVIGAVTFTGGLIMLILAVVRGGAQGWTSALTLIELGVAAALLVAFVARQRVATDPLIPTVLLKMRNVSVGNIIFAFVGTILFSMFFFITLYLQQVREFNSLEAALLYLPVPIGMFLGTQVAPRVLRFGPHNVLGAGLVIQAIALAGWALTMSENGALLVSFHIPATLWAFGLGISIVSSFVVCTMGLDGPIAGAASGMATTSYQGGGAIGLAALVVVADAVTRGGSSSASLIAGYTTALWCAVGIALVGALLTRLIMRGRPIEG